MTNNKNIDPEEFAANDEMWIGILRKLKRTYQFLHKNRLPSAILVPDIPEIDGVPIRYKVLDREANKAQLETDSLESEVAALEATIKDKDETIKKLKDSIDDLNGQINDLNGIIDEITGELNMRACQEPREYPEEEPEDGKEG